MNNRLRQILNVVFGISQLVTNTIWGAGLLGQPNVGQISDSFQTVFTPAGYTFSVWTPIYIGITAYMIYQALPGQANREIHKRIGWWTALAAAMNTIWTPLFVLGFVPLSMIVMIVLLVSLAAVFVTLQGMTLSTRERWLTQVPFSMYFAWITVATVANGTTTLIALNWGGFGVADAIWSFTMLVAATAITSAVLLNSGRNAATLAYLGVLIWALVGVSVGNMPQSSLVGIAALVFAGVLVLVTAYQFFMRGQSQSQTQMPAAA